MKRLHGTAASAVTAPIESCFDLLVAVDRYPTWYPEVVREVEVVERGDGGRPSQARTTLHVSHGPLVRDFRLVLSVYTERPAIVRLTRIPHGPSDSERFQVSWGLRAAGAETRVELELDANLSVPRLVPLGSIGEAMAAGFVAAAEKALRAGGGPGG
jgi:hypothetical protein